MQKTFEVPAERKLSQKRSRLRKKHAVEYWKQLHSETQEYEQSLLLRAIKNQRKAQRYLVIQNGLIYVTIICLAIGLTLCLTVNGGFASARKYVALGFGALAEVCLLVLLFGDWSQKHRRCHEKIMRLRMLTWQLQHAPIDRVHNIIPTPSKHQKHQNDFLLGAPSLSHKDTPTPASATCFGFWSNHTLEEHDRWTREEEDTYASVRSLLQERQEVQAYFRQRTPSTAGYGDSWSNRIRGLFRAPSDNLDDSERQDTNETRVQEDTAGATDQMLVCEEVEHFPNTRETECEGMGRINAEQTTLKNAPIVNDDTLARQQPAMNNPNETTKAPGDQPPGNESDNAVVIDMRGLDKESGQTPSPLMVFDARHKEIELKKLRRDKKNHGPNRRARS